ncbi:hypothetical protein [Scytonema sp. PCC 10023]|uniref:hypothetical protein n=1 Tax=Scytonema sp. PCC 10023 TaxID=1680591 RepID=UPI0039C6730C
MKNQNFPSSPQDFLNIVNYFEAIFSSNNHEYERLKIDYPTLIEQYPELLQEVSKLKKEVRSKIAEFITLIKDNTETLNNISSKYKEIDAQFESLPKNKQPFSGTPDIVEDSKKFSELIKQCLKIEGKCVLLEKPSCHAKLFLSKWGINQAFSKDSPRFDNNFYITKILEKFKKLSTEKSSIQSCYEMDYFKYLAESLTALIEKRKTKSS